MGAEAGYVVTHEGYGKREAGHDYEGVDCIRDHFVIPPMSYFRIPPLLCLCKVKVSGDIKDRKKRQENALQEIFVVEVSLEVLDILPQLVKVCPRIA